MGLFRVLTDVVTMPIRVALDGVQAPFKIMNGDTDILENTVNGIHKIEKDLDVD